MTMPPKGGFILFIRKYILSSMELDKKDFIGLEHNDGSTTKKIIEEDGKLLVQFNGDTTAALNECDELRNEATRLNLKPRFDDDGMVHIGRIPMPIVELWASEGFHINSPERSGMTREEHWAELLKRLSGDYSRLNVSKYRRLA